MKLQENDVADQLIKQEELRKTKARQHAQDLREQAIKIAAKTRELQNGGLNEKVIAVCLKLEFTLYDEIMARRFRSSFSVLFAHSSNSRFRAAPVPCCTVLYTKTPNTPKLLRVFVSAQFKHFGTHKT